MDAFKHVNNTQYFKYQEVCRLAYFDRLMERVAALDPAGEHFDIAGFHDATGIGPIMSATSCRFKFPVTFPDKLLVGGRVDNFSDARFTHHYSVWSLRHNREVSVGTGDVVFYDYSKGNVVPVPLLLQKAMEEVAGTDNSDLEQKLLEENPLRDF
jgi:acyl-CoA thioester hydrolase